MEEERTQKQLNESMQCVALDFLLALKDLKSITNIEEIGFNEQYSCISATINNRKAGVLIFAQMYPNDYEEYIEMNVDNILDTAKQIFDTKTTDIYTVGAGLINNHVPEEEKGIFRIGQKYGVSLGAFNLISIAEDSNYGLSISNPIKLSMVSDEYFYMEHLKSKNGSIEGYDRKGHYINEETGHAIDCWKVLVEVETILERTLPLGFLYYIYTDAYALDNLKISVDDIKHTPIFFEWND